MSATDLSVCKVCGEQANLGVTSKADDHMTSMSDDLPTPVWTAAEAAEAFRQAEYALHAAVQNAQQLTQRLHDRGEISAAAVCDARSAVMFRAAMICAAATQDALREAALPPPDAVEAEGPAA